MKNIGRLLIGAAASLGLLECAAAETLTTEYKEAMKNAGKGLIVGESFTKGAIKYLPEQRGVNSPGVLLMTAEKDSRSSYLGFNINMPKDKIQRFKDKALLFKIYVKCVSGPAPFSITMRNIDNRKEWKLVSASTKKFDAPTGQWEPLIFRSRIPNLENITAVDFQVGVGNPPPNFECLIDEPSLELINEDKNISFDSSFMTYAARNDREPLSLVKDGKPVATIVTAAKPTECVKFAVKELNEHIELCSGTKLPIATDDKKIDGPVIHVGKTLLTERFDISPDKLPADSWIVRRVNNTVIISGGDNQHNINPSLGLYGDALSPFGTLYAVYEFIERQLGVRWYQPGKQGTIAPRSATLSVSDINWTGKPSYSARFTWGGIINDKDISKQDCITWWRRMRRGCEGGSPIGMHSFNKWPERFASSHPEYFAVQADGNRKLICDDMGGHVCLSNPDVIKQTIADTRDFFDKNKWASYSPVMYGDGSATLYCRCKNCVAKMNFSGSQRGMMGSLMWDFVNKTAAEVRKSHPGKFITCCAYETYLDVPDFGLEPNVAVTLCLGGFGGWSLFPANPHAKSKYVSVIQAWKKTGADLYIWDYWEPRFQKGVFGAPAVYPRLLKEYLNLDYGRINGHVLELPGINSKGESVNSWADWRYDSLNVYVGMRLLWDMSQDVDKIINEYCAGLYGPAAPLTKKFYDEMEIAFADPNTKNGPDFRWDWESCWVKTYPPAFVAKMMGYLREAVKTTEGQEPFHTRAKQLLEGFLPFEENSAMFSKAGAKLERSLTVPSVDKAPVIDGALSDECWKNAAVSEDFCDSFGLYKLKSKTDMRLLHDNDNLYIGVTASFPKGAPLKTDVPANSRDGFIYDDESCEVFLTQDNKLYQFIIGPDNILFDLFNPDAKKPLKEEAVKWNCKGVVYKTVRGDGEWTAELAIPLKSLGLKTPSKENPWRVNFCRNHFYKKDGEKTFQQELSTWSPTHGSFHNTDKFGSLIFK